MTTHCLNTSNHSDKYSQTEYSWRTITSTNNLKENKKFINSNHNSILNSFNIVHENRHKEIQNKIIDNIKSKNNNTYNGKNYRDEFINTKNDNNYTKTIPSSNNNTMHLSNIDENFSKNNNELNNDNNINTVKTEIDRDIKNNTINLERQNESHNINSKEICSQSKRKRNTQPTYESDKIS